mmetsp:Transcript_39963/g.100499  ORF Transcript_39963/g.100499 Transcript_39963/m.100499 type:complete len:250 (-) Transcript_39963:63-812(-)
MAKRKLACRNTSLLYGLAGRWRAFHCACAEPGGARGGCRKLSRWLAFTPPRAPLGELPASCANAAAAAAASAASSGCRRPRPRPVRPRPPPPRPPPPRPPPPSRPSWRVSRRRSRLLPLLGAGAGLPEVRRSPEGCPPCCQVGARGLSPPPPPGPPPPRPTSSRCPRAAWVFSVSLRLLSGGTSLIHLPPGVGTGCLRRLGDRGDAWADVSALKGLSRTRAKWRLGSREVGVQCRESATGRGDLARWLL